VEIKRIVLALAIGLLGSTLRADDDLPNIIYIMADDLGYGDLSCFGQAKFETPNIDSLAKEGVTFTNYYAGSTVCAPTRCVLMTGMHTGHAFVRGNREVKPEGQARSFLSECLTIPSFSRSLFLAIARYLKQNLHDGCSIKEDRQADTRLDVL